MSVQLPRIDVIESSPRVTPAPAFAPPDHQQTHTHPVITSSRQSRSPSLPTVVVQPVPIYLPQPRPHIVRPQTCPDKSGDAATPTFQLSISAASPHALPLPGTPSHEVETSALAYAFAANHAATAEAAERRPAEKLKASIASSVSSESYDSNKTRNIKILRVMNPDEHQAAHADIDSPIKSVHTVTSSEMHSPTSPVSPASAVTPATTAPNSQPASPTKKSSGINKQKVAATPEDPFAGLDKLALRLETYLNNVDGDVVEAPPKAAEHATYRKHRPTPLRLIPAISTAARPQLRNSSAPSKLLSPHRFLSASAGSPPHNEIPASPRPPSVNKLARSAAGPSIPIHERKTTLGKDWYGELLEMYRPILRRDDSISRSLHPDRAKTQYLLDDDLAAQLDIRLPSPFEADKIADDMIEHAEHAVCAEQAGLKKYDSIRLIDLESNAGDKIELERFAADIFGCTTPRSAALARSLLLPSGGTKLDTKGEIDLTQDQHRQQEISLMRSHPPSLAPRRVSDNALLPPDLKLVEGNRTCSCGLHAEEHALRHEREEEDEGVAQREARRQRRKQRHQDELMLHPDTGVVHPLLAEQHRSERRGRRMYPAGLSDEERARYRAFDDLARMAVDDGNPFVANPNGAIRLGEYKRGFDDGEIDRWRSRVAELAFPANEHSESQSNLRAATSTPNDILVLGAGAGSDAVSAL